MKPHCSAKVTTWLERQEPRELCTTSITLAEVLAGIAILPSGHKRNVIETAALEMFADDLKGHVLPFDERAAASYAEIFARRRAAGRPAAALDLLVAAIAHSHNAKIATRDVSGFDGFGVVVVNPWE